MKFIRCYDGSKYDFDNFDISYLISRYDIADTWVAESLNNFGIALHEELDNMNTK